MRVFAVLARAMSMGLGGLLTCGVAPMHRRLFKNGNGCPVFSACLVQFGVFATGVKTLLTGLLKGICAGCSAQACMLEFQA